jgi:hypothetical protein
LLQRQPLGDFTLHREISLSQCFVRTMDSPQMLGQGQAQGQGQAGCDPAASAAWFPFTVESPSKSFVVLCRCGATWSHLLLLGARWRPPSL